MKETVLERFLRYVTFDTTSDPETGAHPSTPGQLVLGKQLAEVFAHRLRPGGRFARELARLGGAGARLLFGHLSLFHLLLGGGVRRDPGGGGVFP